MTYRVGLSGGIGSGKSTVAALFQELGVQIIDSDAIAHRLTQVRGEAIPLIRGAFGDAYINADGALNRAKMRSLVFSHDDAKVRLEAILHPLILSQMMEEAETAAGVPYVILVIPLLFEFPGFRALVHRTLVVDCPEETQIQRTMARSALSREEVRTIMARQISRADRLKLANDIIQNEDSLEELRPRVLELHHLYLDCSSRMGAFPSGGARQNN